MIPSAVGTKGVEIGSQICVPEMSARTKNRCAVVGCVGSDKSNHVVPQQPELRKVWLQRIGLRTTDTRKFIYVCNRHFSTDAYNMNPQLMRAMGFSRRQQLRTDAVPTLHLPTPKEGELLMGPARSTMTCRQALALPTPKERNLLKGPAQSAMTCTQALTLPTPKERKLLKKPARMTCRQALAMLAARNANEPPHATPTATSGHYPAVVSHQAPEHRAVCTLAVQASPCRHAASTQTSVEHLGRSIGTQAYLGIKLLVSVETQTCCADG